MELVQEIHQLLMDREDTCHRTCFSLQLNGNSLDNFAELKTVEGKLVPMWHARNLINNDAFYCRNTKYSPYQFLLTQIFNTQLVRTARWVGN